MFTRVRAVCGCFRAIVAEPSGFDRDHMAPKAYDVHYLVLRRIPSLGLCLILLFKILWLDPLLSFTELILNYCFPVFKIQIFP